MRTIHLAAFIMGFLTLSVAKATAQTSSILNIIKVQRALMEYFNETAKRHTRTANEHQQMSMSYRGTRIPSAAVHCDRMVTVSRDSAKEATAAATMHKDLAAIAR